MAASRGTERGRTRFRAYGVLIDSTVELPLKRVDDAGAAIRVRRKALDTPADTDTEGRRVRATPTDVTYHEAGLGTMRVRRDGEIAVDPAAGESTATLPDWIVTVGLGCALHLSGRPVLHASVVSIDGRGVAFLGGPGAGKSTVATACLAAGARLVTDDVCVLDRQNTVTVQSGPPSVKLDPDTLERITQSMDGAMPGAEKLGSVRGKQRLRVKQVAEGPIGLDRIYLLRAGTPVSVEGLAGSDRVLALLSNAYANRRLEATETAATYFNHVEGVADAVPIKRLARPTRWEALPTVVKAIREDLHDG